MNTLLLILLITYIIIVSFIAVASIFQVTGLLVFLLIILSILLVFTIFYLTVFFIIRKQTKNVEFLKLDKTIKASTKLIKLTKLFPFLKFRNIINLTNAYILTGNEIKAKETLNNITVTKLKNKNDLLTYFFTQFSLCQLLNDIQRLETYSTNLNKLMVDENQSINSTVSNIKNIINFQINMPVLEPEKIYAEAKVNYEKFKTPLANLELLYSSFIISKCEETTFEQLEELTSLAKDTYFSKYID